MSDDDEDDDGKVLIGIPGNNIKKLRSIVIYIQNRDVYDAIEASVIFEDGVIFTHFKIYTFLEGTM